MCFALTHRSRFQVQKPQSAVRWYVAYCMGLFWVLFNLWVWYPPYDMEDVQSAGFYLVVSSFTDRECFEARKPERSERADSPAQFNFNAISPHHSYFCVTSPPLRSFKENVLENMYHSLHALIFLSIPPDSSSPFTRPIVCFFFEVFTQATIHYSHTEGLGAGCCTRRLTPPFHS